MLVRWTKSFAALVYPWQVGAHLLDLVLKLPKVDRGQYTGTNLWTGCLRWCMSPVIPTVEALDARTCKALQRLDPAVACTPDSVMSDRGHPQFNNLCWKEVDNVKSMRRKLFSAFRPQTYGRIENKPHFGGNIVGVCATRSDKLGWALGTCKASQKLLEPMRNARRIKLAN